MTDQGARSDRHRGHVIPDSVTEWKAQGEASGQRIEGAARSLGKIETAFGIGQELGLGAVSGQQLEMMGARRRGPMAVGPAARTRGEHVGAVRPAVVAQRLLHHTAAQQPAAQDRCSLVVDGPPHALGGRPRVVEDVERAVAQGHADGGLGMAPQRERVGFEGMGDRFVQQDRGGSGTQDTRSAGRFGRCCLVAPSGAGEATCDVVGGRVVERGEEGAEARPGHLGHHAVVGLVLDRRRQAAADDLQPPAVPPDLEAVGCSRSTLAHGTPDLGGKRHHVEGGGRRIPGRDPQARQRIAGPRDGPSDPANRVAKGLGIERVAAGHPNPVATGQTYREPGLAPNVEPGRGVLAGKRDLLPPLEEDVGPVGGLLDDLGDGARDARGIDLGERQWMELRGWGRGARRVDARQKIHCIAVNTRVGHHVQFNRGMVEVCRDPPAAKTAGQTPRAESSGADPRAPNERWCAAKGIFMSRVASGGSDGGVRRVTTRSLREAGRRRGRITMVTAYDYPSARAVDAAGIDAILVGDSLAMVVLGHDSTLPVTMDEMLHHAKAVRRGTARALCIGDMPFMSYQTGVADAMRNAGRYLQEAGMDAVKLEGGSPVLDVVRALVRHGIPVQGHLGLTPQHVHQLGGYRVQARDHRAALTLLDDARRLEDAGCFSLVLESVPARLGRHVTDALEIPTIGIGAGEGTSGQVLVFHDLLGIEDRINPRFLRRFANLGADIHTALEGFRDAVTDGSFPAAEHTYEMPDEEWVAFLDGVSGASPETAPR